MFYHVRMFYSKRYLFDIIEIVDDTRVRLTRGSNDYINANYVEVPLANRKYILTQVKFIFNFSSIWNSFGKIGTTSINSKSFLANDLGTK